MKNLYNISKNHIQIENGNVYNINDLNDIDISGISNIISSLDLKMKTENQVQTYFIDPSGIIQNLPGLLSSSKIQSENDITFSQLISLGNGFYQLEFTCTPSPEVNESIIISIDRPNESQMKFSAKVISKIGNNFIIEEKFLNSKLINDIQQGSNIIYKIYQYKDSHLIDYNQIFILLLASIKNLSNRIKDLENKSL
jgi:hypothetical protein